MGGSGWGTQEGRIHVDVWQNQYNTVKKKKKRCIVWVCGGQRLEL